VVEVFAKLILPDELLQIAMSGDYTRRPREPSPRRRRASTSPSSSTRSSFGCNHGRHVADLVEKQGTAVRLLKLSDVRALAPVKSLTCGSQRNESVTENGHRKNCSA